MENRIISLIIFLTSAMMVESQNSDYFGSSGSLSRVPGLRPAIAYPQFLSSRHELTSQEYTGSRSENMCPTVNRNCPRDCRKIDERRCRICHCGVKDNTSQMTSVPKGSATSRCFPMVQCMLSCKTGYTLGESVDSNGCQACTCTDSNQHHEYQSGDYSGHGENSWGLNLEPSGSNPQTGSEPGVDKGTRKDWTKMMGSNAGSSSGQISHGENVLSSGESSKTNSGINPMFPGASLNADKGSRSCSGPFCLDQSMSMSGSGITSGGGAMVGARGGSGTKADSDSCSGPFCISGGMMGGAKGGMGGVKGGMGGSSTGLGNMGGGMGSGMAGFSPFGLAASTSGCNGPFCSMSNNGRSGNMHAGNTGNGL